MFNLLNVPRMILLTAQPLAAAEAARPTSPQTTSRSSRAGRTDTAGPASASARGTFDHYRMRAVFRAAPLAFATMIILVIAAAWTFRHEGYIAADSGLGYWLGIAGAIIMILLLLYPLRKRYRFLNWTGAIAGWFRLHMILGILGPTLVILHTNFKLGSLNSRLALFTMLVVVASGIAGRYLYSKVHKGLYGAHAHVRDIASDLASLQAGLGDAIPLGDDFKRALASEVDLQGSADLRKRRASARSRRRRLSRMARHDLAADPDFARLSLRARRTYLRSIDRQIATLFAARRKAQRLALFDRLFGYWHHLHVPLFVLLVVTVGLHIVAVHRY